ncbi:MAG TPA: M43 family zinc metalloprotease, partial [Saprospiraceae bacterium]|nr:M43 family zinc metalloprotease [Saprospiraceae bacterium]HMT71733.1 M43 family zinc metalloprotease [Saprospiraceae bacterium]
MIAKTYSTMIRFYLILITFSLCQLLPAQDHYPCGAVEMQKKLFSIDKKWQELQERSEQLLVKKKGGFVANRTNELFTLPVVVHVIHNNGSENISDIQIDQALANLNAAFSHSGPYKSKGEGFNTEIQFCLARRTFDNNATTGVNRIVSGLTNLTMETEDQALKNLSRWDPTQYINIWVVNEISSQSQGSGVAGYAYLAGMHGKPLDGLVCEAKFFGKSPSDDVVLIHEMGHYLNLLHTFDGGCTNNFCDQEGDKVCDTPPDQALHSSCVFNSCGTDKNDSRPINPFTTDVNDMTQNYMDYSPFECQFAFTKGQAERMRLTIQNIRESLLQSQGCLSPCVSTISGGISAPQEAVTGQNVNLSFSGSGATTFLWSVDGTQISTSQAQDYVFTAPGTYTIALVAGNQDVNCV